MVNDIYNFIWRYLKTDPKYAFKNASYNLFKYHFRENNIFFK